MSLFIAQGNQSSMRFSWAAWIIVIYSLIEATVSHAKYLYHGDCVLKTDPAVVSQPLVTACVNAEAKVISAQKSKTPHDKQPPTLYIAKARAGVFLTPYLSAHGSARTLRYEDRDTAATLYRETSRDDVSLQLGNYALSRHRVNAGFGRPKVNIDHNQREDLEYIWSIPNFEMPFVSYATYTYDNQLDLTFQATYGQLQNETLNDRQKLFGAARIMYDIAALEGTRIVVGGSGDGLLRRSANIGLLNVNGKGDETAIEVTRSFNQAPYDPDEFRQLIRLSYISHLQDKSRAKFQYDDIFRHYRIGSMAGIYEFLKYGRVEAHVGYAKNEAAPGQSHWFGLLMLGAKS